MVYLYNTLILNQLDSVIIAQIVKIFQLEYNRAREFKEFLPPALVRLRIFADTVKLARFKDISV